MTRALLHRALTAARRRRSRPVSTPYASHVPVLAALARCAKIERVLELGCGRYSTLTFLDRTTFPDLVHIDSLEDDAAWMQEIVAATQHDSRITLSFVEGDWAARIDAIDFSAYDLVFVDNGRTRAERAATIRQVSGRAARGNIIVVHDFEETAYRMATNSLPHRVGFEAFLPNTGVGWVGDTVSREQLMQFRSLIRRTSRDLQPDAVDVWPRFFDAHLAAVSGGPPSYSPGGRTTQTAA